MGGAQDDHGSGVARDLLLVGIANRLVRSGNPRPMPCPAW